MCVEAYSTKAPIVIKYSNELVRFFGPRAFHGRYTLLIENGGTTPVDEVIFVYPRPLMTVKEVGGKRRAGIVIGDLIPWLYEELKTGIHNDKVLVNDRMTWFLPDPNDPTVNLRFEGRFDPTNVKYSQPRGITPSHVELINENGMSAWCLKFIDPIKPGDRHWVSFMTDVKNAGLGVDGWGKGSFVYHRLASPISVWRLFSETMVSGASIVYGPIDNTLPNPPNIVNSKIGLYEDIVAAFGLKKQRDVQIQHYLLEVNPGPVAERIFSCPSVEGDLWMRSASPMVVPGPNPDAPTELAFLWKSGVNLAQFPVGRKAAKHDIEFALQFAIESESPPGKGHLWA